MKISKKVFFGTTSALGLSVLYSYYYAFTKIMDKENRGDAWVDIKGFTRILYYLSSIIAAISYLRNYFFHYKIFDENYRYISSRSISAPGIRRKLFLDYIGFLVFSAIWAPYTANFINKRKKYKKVKNEKVYNKYGVAFILTMVTVFAYRKRSINKGCNTGGLVGLKWICGIKPGYKDNDVGDNLVFLQVFIVNNILWLRKFWKKY
jgi:hypothetical protein